mmetsp:Transcript_124240/g.359290  ORF Transcript_124240/g.359290 Transcript_124240/m.359290 type:complete len:626 (+) Transcript_124240:109-1986(+)
MQPWAGDCSVASRAAGVAQMRSAAPRRSWRMRWAASGQPPRIVTATLLAVSSTMGPEVAEALSVFSGSSASSGRVVVARSASWGSDNSSRWPVAQRQESLRGYGGARYPDDDPLATWEDYEEQGRLGAACDPGGSVVSQCGRNLVCRQGICRRCIEDDECPSLHRCLGVKFGNGHCERIEQKAWERAFTDPYEGLCTFAIFFASALAAAAGTGGGGMFVPLLVSLSGLKAENAVPLSQAMILGGSIINLSVFLSQRHPEVRQEPVIDYDCVVLLEPMLCLGVMCGVLVNQISPQWLLLLLLTLSLGLALYRTGTKGIKQLHAERAAAARAAEAANQPAQGAPATPIPQEPQTSSTRRRRQRSCFDMLVSEDFLELTNKKAWQVIGTVVVWLSMLASSFHGLSVCSWKFAGFLVQIAGILLFCTFVAGRRIQRTAAEAVEAGGPGKGPFDWTAKGPLHFPMVAFGAGFLGGLLGIGGGMIMSPVLVEVGMHSEAVQATTAVFVFLSSSLATIQFARLKQHVWHYVVWYGSVTVVATILGQYLCDIYVRKHKRYSLITIAICGVLLGSLSALLFIGIGQVIEDFYMGKQMWFAFGRLCNRDGGGIFAVDVAPADSWPTDLPRWRDRR